MSITNQLIDLLETNSGDFHTEMFKLAFLALAFGIVDAPDRQALMEAARKREAADCVANNCSYEAGNELLRDQPQDSHERNREEDTDKQ